MSIKINTIEWVDAKIESPTENGNYKVILSGKEDVVGFCVWDKCAQKSYWFVDGVEKWRRVKVAYTKGITIQ